VIRVNGSGFDLTDSDYFVVGLARDHLLFEKFAIASDVQLSLGVRRLGDGEIGDAEILILLRCFHTLLRLSEIGCRVFDRDLVVARIEINQRLAFLDVVSILDVHRDNGIVDSSTYRIKAAVDFGIVGPFVRAHVIPKAQPGKAQKYCAQRHYQRDRAAVNRVSSGAVLPIRAIGLSVLSLIRDVRFGRLRTALQSSLLVSQPLQFQPELSYFPAKLILLLGRRGFRIGQSVGTRRQLPRTLKQLRHS